MKDTNKGHTKETKEKVFYWHPLIIGLGGERKDEHKPKNISFNQFRQSAKIWWWNNLRETNKEKCPIKAHLIQFRWSDVEWQRETIKKKHRMNVQFNKFEWLLICILWWQERKKARKVVTYQLQLKLIRIVANLDHGMFEERKDKKSISLRCT